MEAFIRLENTFEKAMNYKTSPDIQFYYFGGIQLLSNNEFPYLQTTKNDDGVELEDFTEINVRSMCGELLANIADYFEVADNFQDPDTGLPQITWKILPNVPFDFGKRLVYLEVKQNIGETFYSSPFMLTSEDAEFTSRIDYKNTVSELMQSVQVNMWFFDFNLIKEYSQYWEVSTKNTQTNTIKSQATEIFLSDISDKRILSKIIDVFDYRFTYLNLKRASIFEPATLPEREGNENFGEIKIVFSFNENDTYDPNYVIPVPPPEPPQELAIIINDIQKIPTDYKNFNVFFQYIGFVPSYVATRFRLTGTSSWNDSTGSPISPRIVRLPLESATFGTEYDIQMYNQGTEIQSNTARYIHVPGFYLVIPIRLSEDTWRFIIRFDLQYWENASYLSWFVNGQPTIEITNNGYASRDISGLQEFDEVSMYITDGLNPSQITTIIVQ